MTEIEAFKTWFSTSGFWNNAITGKAWTAACKWQREQLAAPSPISDQAEGMGEAIGDLLPCPFCFCTLVPNTNQEDIYVQRYGTHWDHPSGSCFLTDAEVTPGEVDNWNRRSTAPTTGSAPEMTNGDFHCPACGEVKKGPLFCGNCLWQAPEVIDAEIAASSAASVLTEDSIVAAIKKVGQVTNGHLGEAWILGEGDMYFVAAALLAASMEGE